MQFIPGNWIQIFLLATKIYDGLVLYAAAIPVTMVTAAQMLTSKTAFKNAGDAYNAARTNRNSAHRDAKPAETALYNWLLAARAILALQLGKRWSPQWAAAGFVSPTTEVPRSISAQIGLGKSLDTYFTNNPGRERPDDDITAAKAAELTLAATTAQTAVVTAEEAFKAANDVRKPAKANTLHLISEVIVNLDKKLAPDDPRWLAFGLQLPSTPTTPAAPTGLRATVMGTQVLLECDAMERATRYRFRGKILGLDTTYKRLGSAVAPMLVLEGLAAGLTIEIFAQAVNGPSQSVASAPIFVTMPPADNAAPASAKAEPASADTEMLAPLAAISTDGNGNGNGTHAVNRLS